VGFLSTVRRGCRCQSGERTLLLSGAASMLPVAKQKKAGQLSRLGVIL